MPNDYSYVTTEMFDNKLAELANVDLSIPGMYEVVSEEYNNEVLEALDREHEKNAYAPTEDTRPAPFTAADLVDLEGLSKGLRARGYPEYAWALRGIVDAIAGFKQATREGREGHEVYLRAFCSLQPPAEEEG